MKRKIFVVIPLILAGLLSWQIAPEPEHSRNGFAMNTLIHMTLFSRDDNLINDAYELLAKLDNSLSMYNPSSDISRINSSAGREKFHATPEVIEAVKNSMHIYDITGGIFNPLIGPVSRLWSINRADNTVPTQASLDIAIRLSNIDNLELTDNSIYLKHEGCIMDLSGIAKGYASEKLAAFLKSRGVKSGIMDLGGNVYVIGKNNKSGENWKIGVRNPLEIRGAPVLVLSVSDCAVITSGNYERYKIVDGKKYSHFFDSKTGDSIMSDLLSVTLVTPDGSLADGLATAFMICGYDEAVRILANLSPMPGVIFIRENSQGEPEITASENLRDKIINSRYAVNFF